MATAKKVQGKNTSQATSAARSSITSASVDASFKKDKILKKTDTKNVAQRAYEIYCERKHKGIPGTAESDWEQAEEELRP